MTGPLTSLKILDFSRLLPGPYGSMMLADLGADVLRVEVPGRPDVVHLLPPFDGEHAAWNSVLNRNKRSIALNMKQPGAADVIKRLVTDGGYDIVLEQFRPGVMDRLGIGYEVLQSVQPGLIYCAVTGYGQTGPYRDRAGHDNNYLALAGIMSHSGRVGQGPPPLGVQIADVGGGAMGAVMGILAAVIHRQQTGEGQLVDISMFDMSVAWQAHIASHYLIADDVPEREGWRLNGGGTYDYYETSDGRYLAVGSLEPKFWRQLCEAIDRPDLVSAGLVPHPQPAEVAALKRALRSTIGARTFAAWCDVFAGTDACVEPVLTIAEMVGHPQTQAREMVVAVPKPEGGMQAQIASPLKLSKTPAVYRHIGPAPGQDTVAALTTAGFSPEEVAQLRADGVFGG